MAGLSVEYRGKKTGEDLARRKVGQESKTGSAPFVGLFQGGGILRRKLVRRRQAVSEEEGVLG